MRIAVVGAGFAGATIAERLGRLHSVYVFEARHHVGGNAYTERDYRTGVMKHVYGPHIFHTADEDVRAYVGRFDFFKPFELRMKSIHDGHVYSFPINLHTINQFWKDCMTPVAAADVLKRHGYRACPGEPYNFKDAACKKVGEELYEAFLEGYTRKQWGVEPDQLPASLADRLPVRFDYEDNKYPPTEFQGIPIEGYTRVIERMLQDIPVHLGTKFIRDHATEYDHVFYSGPLDAWFGYQYGRLRYRTVKFIDEVTDGDAQGCAVIACPDMEQPWTRMTEHKHLAPWEAHDKTILSFEYSSDCHEGDEPMYPMRLEKDKLMLDQYKELAAGEKRVTFIGRLGTYRYIDMDQTIAESLKVAAEFLR